MADKQISQLVAATTINNDDLFVMQQGGTAKKLSGQKLSDFVYQSAANQIERVNEAVEQTQAAVDYLEEQKNEIAQVVADMAQLGTDTTLSTPGMAADAKATGEVKAVALARFEQKEITGVPIATFDDGADDAPVKKLVVNIDPVQSGSGDPSPTNVRPITGWTGANVYRTGFNQWDEEWEVGTIKDSDGSYIGYDNAIRSKNFIPVIEGQSYYFKTPDGFNGAGANSKIYWYGSGKDYRGVTGGRDGTVNYIGNGVQYVKFALNGINTYNGGICFNFTDPAKNGTYEPYQGTTYPITFPSEAGTVYGGTLDVTNGVLTVDRVMVTLDGSEDETFGNGSSGAAFYYRPSVTNIKHPATSTEITKMITNYLKVVTQQSTWRRDGIISQMTNDIIVFFNCYAAGETVSELRTYLGTHNLQICFELETPITYTLTPIEVRTLLALNNIWADTGNILDLIYRRQPISDADIQESIDAIRDAIADREDSGVASKNYSTGALILVGDTLYETFGPITTGESIVPGSNCTATTVAAQIAYIKSIINGLGNIAYLSYEDA